jgi:hypothetical protein
LVSHTTGALRQAKVEGLRRHSVSIVRKLERGTGAQNCQ